MKKNYITFKILKYFFSGKNTNCKDYKYFFNNKKAEIQSQPEI